MINIDPFQSRFSVLMFIFSQPPVSRLANSAYLQRFQGCLLARTSHLQSLSTADKKLPFLLHLAVLLKFRLVQMAVLSGWNQLTNMVSWHAF